MNKLLLTLLSFALIGSVVAGEKKEKKEKKPKLTAGMYVEFHTTKGLIICKLEHEKTPMTVANFVGLAEGNLKVESHSYDAPFYDGVKFHRVINDFMIQGGDPQGNGSGGPDHRMYDETRDDLTHSGPGILSMANSDPQGSKERYSNAGMTNGSQFFITHKATPHLDGLHTVFGHVIFGQDIVNAIEQGDEMTEVVIIRVGKSAKAWNATDTYKSEAYNLTEEGQVALLKKNKELIKTKTAEADALSKVSAAQKKEKKKAKIDAQIASIKEEVQQMTKVNNRIEASAIAKALAAAEKARIDKISKMSVAEYNVYLLDEVKKSFPNAQQTASGLVYVIDNAGNDDHIIAGSEVTTHCTGNFRTSGDKFFSTHDGANEPMKFTYKVNRMVPGWEEGLAMIGAGAKAKFFLPYHLAYGAKGRGAAIPAYSDLIFTTDVESVVLPAPPELNEDGTPKVDHSGHNHDGHNHDGHNH